MVTLLGNFTQVGQPASTPYDKKHEPSKLNCKTFSDELTPLGMNSLSYPLQMDVVYENLPF
jgi:hypothetical protein